MTEDALIRGNEIRQSLKHLNSQVELMSKTNGSFLFAQRNPLDADFQLQVPKDLKTEMDKQLNTVMQVTKQMIKSLFELEISNLKKELDQL